MTKQCAKCGKEILPSYKWCEKCRPIAEREKRREQEVRYQQRKRQQKQDFINKLIEMRENQFKAFGKDGVEREELMSLVFSDLHRMIEYYEQS